MTDTIDANQSHFNRLVWYAGEQRAASTWKALVYDDKGPLSLDQDKLEFRGETEKITIHWSDVVRIEYRRQAFASDLIAVFVALTALFAGLNGLLSDVHPVLYALLGAAIPVVIYWFSKDQIANQTTKLWTVLYFQQPNGLSQAWFVDGEHAGWAAKGRKASELHDKISVHCSVPVITIGDGD